MRYGKDEITWTAEQSLPAGQEEHTPDEHKQREFHMRRQVEADRQAVIDARDHRVQLECLVGIWECRAEEYERTGSREVAHHYRGCAGTIRRMLSGKPLELKEELDRMLGVRDARWSDQ